MSGRDLTPREDDEYAGFGRSRSRRVRVVAWVAIVSLIVVGGGATALSLLLG